MYRQKLKQWGSSMHAHLRTPHWRYVSLFTAAISRCTCSNEDLLFLPVKFNPLRDEAFVGGTKGTHLQLESTHVDLLGDIPEPCDHCDCITIVLHCDMFADFLKIMDCKLLVVASLLVLPGVVVCDYPWPDKVTQYKGYIQVSQVAAALGGWGCYVHVNTLRVLHSQTSRETYLQWHLFKSTLRI